jgi:malonyl-CoA O-methyltransferase
VRPPGSDTAARTLLQFGPWFVGAGLWAWAKFPERLRWTEDVFARIFGLLAAVYDDWTEAVPGYGDALEEAIEEIRRAPSTVLDLATGTGFVARRLKRQFPEAEVIGVDIAPEMIAIAQHDAVAEGLDLKFEIGNLSELPFGDEMFEVVVQQNAMPYPDEIMRVLARGGTALIVFSFAGPWVALAWSAIAERLERAGAITVFGRTAGIGFYGLARKT